MAEPPFAYLFRCLEAQTDFAVVAKARFARALQSDDWNSQLLLESTFVLQWKTRIAN